MPSGSTNYDAVYKFLNFISRPENVIRNMDYTGYTSMVATDEILEEIVIGWFDESEDLEEDEWVIVDYSYLFGGNAGDYQVVVSEEGYGKNEYVVTTRPLVVVTAPGPGSGKWQLAYLNFTTKISVALKRGTLNMKLSPCGICR